MDGRIKLLIRRIALISYDVVAIFLSSALGLLARFEFSINNIDASYLNAVKDYFLINVVVTILIFIVMRLYNSLWQYASVSELENVIIACMLSAVTQIVGMHLMHRRVPISFHFVYYVCLTVLVIGSRFLYRFLRNLISGKQKQKQAVHRVMVVGAGDAGNVLVREMTSSSFLQKKVCCIIDDDPLKIGSFFRGIEIVGSRQEIPAMARKYDINEIIVAMPSVSVQERREILEICQTTDCELKMLPGMYQLINGDVSVSRLRNVEIEDLLGREPIRVDITSILDYVNGKVVMVTGGGGSIGSELCRQIAEHGPKTLIIVDIYENNAYEIQQELRRRKPELDLVVLIASVRNTHRIESIFEKYRPDIVYHAAAHKHVPLMEDSPNEAIKNNVFGTYKTAKAAVKYGASRFVLISTDKAVNPTNIMGASKRICEMIVQMMNGRSNTEFVAVRFGNVLGSNGSVIPLFKKQIEEGGPVTVTHPDIIRYFMTIPEAVSLVLQAGVMAKGGEIFILDMGEPVKILDLAKNLIRLSGYRPFEDIDIKFTGLRPGEKLYEELLMAEEGMKETPNKLIHIGKPIEFDEDLFSQQLDELMLLANSDSELVRQKVREIVPTYVIKRNEY
ncbi:MAG: polysaccharide biosynthesis protein [Lachnospiraceae bacterium]|nr:polysaccharide biosynthesis protein [Lachnospiraceae bacterium]